MYKKTRLGAASQNRTFYGTLLFLFTIPVSYAVLVNRTIDSFWGDPVTGFVPIYQPQNFWAFDGTWNSATYIPGKEDVNVTLRFTGVAVWVFLIVSNNGTHGSGLTKYTAVNITLDGKSAKPYHHSPDMNKVDPSYNVSIFSQKNLENISHELVIGTNDYDTYSYINFDWAIYTVDDGTPAGSSQSISTTTASFSMASTSPSTPAPPSMASTPSSTQSSSSNIGVIVGSTLGGLAVIALVLVFFIRHLHRAPPVQYKKDEGMLEIDVPTTHHQLNHNRESPVSVHAVAQNKAIRERQRQIQRELDNLRNAGSADEIGNPSPAGPSQPSPDFASLQNDPQQLRDRIEHLHTQRESDLALAPPPAYTNNVQ